ncbi:MAG: TMEM175 family protein [Candidatus Micrarchaeota archaeon]
MADESAWLATNRLEALTDGIFAFAMTLLVLSITLPDDPDGIIYLPDAELRELISHEWLRFMNYAIAFLLLASFWMNHSKAFHIIKATEHKHTWINVLFLMFVALVPFTTGLVGDYGGDSIAWTMFGANMFILGSFLYLNLWYAGRNPHLLHEGVGMGQIEIGKRRNLVVLAVSTLSIFISFYDTGLAGPVYFLIPLVMLLSPFKHEK